MALQTKTEAQQIKEVEKAIMAGVDVINGTECYELLYRKAKKLEQQLIEEKESKIALIKEYISISIGRDRQRYNSPQPYNLRTQG